METYSYARREEVALVVLAAAEERVERHLPGERMDALLAAGGWVGDVLADVLEDAVFVTAGSCLQSVGPDQIRRHAAAADSTYAGAGALILIKAADWADADDDRDLVLALGVESPETVAADSGFNRWLDRSRPNSQRDLTDLAEAAVVALAEMWPLLARATTYETIQWWLGPGRHDHASGGPEVRWDSIARSLLAAIDAGPGPAPTPQDLRTRSRNLLADCSREALLEVVQDALFTTAQWAQIESEEMPLVAADMDAVFARTGALWKAVEADLAVAGGWYADLVDCDPEPLDVVRARPALERWGGDARWTDDGAIEYGAAALAIFTNDRIDAALGNMTDNEIIDLWASGYLPIQIGPQPRHWPPEPQYRATGNTP